MTPLVSTRLDLAGGMDTLAALEAIAEHEPMVSQRLARADARLVAAFKRTDGREHWRTMIFATDIGTECWTLAEEWSNRDDHGTWVIDYETVSVERSDARGDSWPGACDSQRLFPLPTGGMIYRPEPGRDVREDPPFGW